MSRRQKKAIREKKQIASLCVQVALLRTFFQNIIQATVFWVFLSFQNAVRRKGTISYSKLGCKAAIGYSFGCCQERQLDTGMLGKL